MLQKDVDMLRCISISFLKHDFLLLVVCLHTGLIRNTLEKYMKISRSNFLYFYYTNNKVSLYKGMSVSWLEGGRKWQEKLGYMVY